MTFFDLANIFLSEEDCIRYLISEGVIAESKICISCNKDMLLNLKRKTYRCSTQTCRREISILKHTFFSNCKLQLNKFMYLIHEFLHNMPITNIIEVTGIQSESVVAWTSYVRQLLGDNVHMESVQIGGPGVIVEVDETKMGKRKYNRGHHVEGVWVIAGVERTPDRNFFLVEVINRNTDTIKTILSTHVLPGSIIYTDCWSSYFPACVDLNFEHRTVNHSENFVNPYDGTHTNTIEGTNNALKLVIKPQHRTKRNINEHLWYFIWLRQNKKNKWLGFMNALRELEYE